MRPLLTPYLKDRRNRIAARYAHGEILDLGCGSASILLYIKDRGRYVGVDNDPDFIDGLRSRNDLFDASFHLGDLDSPDLALAGLFDTILMVAVIEHLKDPGKLLTEIRGLLKQGGSMVVTTPTPLADILHGLMARIGLTHKEAVRQHHHLYNRKNMLELLSSHGFSLVRYRRFELGLNQLFICRG